MKMKRQDGKIDVLLNGIRLGVEALKAAQPMSVTIHNPAQPPPSITVQNTTPGPDVIVQNKVNPTPVTVQNQVDVNPTPVSVENKIEPSPTIIVPASEKPRKNKRVKLTRDENGVPTGFEEL